MPEHLGTACITKLLMMLLLMPASVQALDYTWSDNGNGTCTITGYIGTGGAVIIPDTIDGLMVTSIGDSAFEGCESLAGITIGDTITSIGDSAFERCTNLTSATIGNSVISIGNRAFLFCFSLTRIAVPNSVISIGNYAFYSCENLTSVKLGNGITSIGDGAFLGCYDLTGVYFKGNAPTLGSNLFVGDDNLIVYYLPCNAASWPASFGDRPTALWPRPAADIDVDGEIGFTDFSIFSGKWFKTNCDESSNWCNGTDFDHTGRVDMLDLAVFVDYWLE